MLWLHRIEFLNQYWGVSWNTSIGWIDIMVADVNGDGKDDIVGRLNGEWWRWTARSNSGVFNSVYLGKWSNTVTWTNVDVGNFA